MCSSRLVHIRDVPGFALKSECDRSGIRGDVDYRTKP
jgi:hypothetical protein